MRKKGTRTRLARSRLFATQTMAETQEIATIHYHSYQTVLLRMGPLSSIYTYVLQEKCTVVMQAYQQANWSLKGEISSNTGSLLDLYGAHSFIKCSSPSTKASSRMELDSTKCDGELNVWEWAPPSSRSISSARVLDLGSSDPGSLPISTSSKTVRASKCRACLIKQRHKLHALFTSGSISWAFL